MSSQFDGYDVLAEVRLTTNKKGQCKKSPHTACFHLKARENVNERPLLLNTFVNVHSERGVRAVYLKDKDIIKMGKELYQVHRNNRNIGEGTMIQLQPELGICRICLSSDNSRPEDYLVSPCRCSGSCSSIHLSCLREWIRHRVVLKHSKKAITYSHVNL